MKTDASCAVIFAAGSWERTNAWLGQFRRLLLRHEHLLSPYRAFFHLAGFWITLRHCL
jgi:transposase